MGGEEPFLNFTSNSLFLGLVKYQPVGQGDDIFARGRMELQLYVLCRCNRLLCLCNFEFVYLDWRGRHGESTRNWSLSVMEPSLATRSTNGRRVFPSFTNNRPSGLGGALGALLGWINPLPSFHNCSMKLPCDEFSGEGGGPAVRATRLIAVSSRLMAAGTVDYCCASCVGCSALRKSVWTSSWQLLHFLSSGYHLTGMCGWWCAHGHCIVMDD
ncbi:hypothetical protein DAPPUDRAFT_105568 [Daphnia pulex]|uniref:Uncharacterized protein n=1 Tax=Daphnia pulex TaxID=6669 RepID=E9GR50_DAPPU|nr:hypothetical protein DAPPUDRAFT_105568 [Daphnia pulex]|eukprot:EFX77947.1 hypothetical protein DAPPUDRAFT_105568 [Daphnia pulex]